MSFAEIRVHWSRVAALGCCLSHTPNPTLHHIHGGSCKDIGLHKGMGQKTSDWLVIPLHAIYHTGQFGIDGAMGVAAWEEKFGTQVSHLDRICLELDVNLWKKAGLDRDPWSLRVMPANTKMLGASDS